MKTTHTVVTDDIDGSDGAETISFDYQGIVYSIDLADKNAAKFEKALSPCGAAAQRVGGRKNITRGRSRNPRMSSTGNDAGATNGTRRDLSAVRAWARENGYEVADRGRIHTDILEAYNAS